MDFAGKKLKKLPLSMINDREGIRKVDLQRNRLRDVIGISHLSNLKELNLSRNDLGEFPREIRELQQLEKLYMNQNNIKSIPENVFPQLKRLTFLKLSTNRLTDLPLDMKHCQSLSYLNISNNSLRDLQSLVGLPRLKELFVERNRLEELPVSLFQGKEFSVFKASGNPLRKPPEEVCAGGLKDIKSYFSMLEDSSSSVSTVKTMFLGSSMAGKSTLCRSLKKGQPEPVGEDDRTVGIEIFDVEKENIRFLFWDFAGQEEYYFTHHVFITPNAFVILTVDLCSYDMDKPKSFDENVSFWLKNIQLKVPNSVVLLVGTHADECKDATEVSGKKRDIEKKVKEMLSEWKENLSQQKKTLQDLKDPALFSEQIDEIDRLSEYDFRVLDLIPMDCTKSEDINRLLNHILQTVSNKNTFPNIEMTLPRCYQEVEQDIKKLIKEEAIPQHGIVALDDLLAQLKDRHEELNNEKLSCILRYLHRIGIIMWYEEIPALRNMVFVEPSFLISLFKTIVRHDLAQQLEAIPKNVLKQENALHIHRDTWIRDFQEKATLTNKAIRILVRSELKQLALDDEDLVEEVVGTKERAGNLLTLLQHFEVCLPSKLTSPLNPEAKEFTPDRKWQPSNPSIYNPDGACLFPSFLSNNTQIEKMWGMDNPEDLRVHVYFLPEIPHGFFHRLIVKTCSFYPTHWVGLNECCFCSGEKRVLLREHRSDTDHFIEIRYKKTILFKPEEIQKAWDMVKVIMMKLAVLTKQWRGLCQLVHSPCRHQGCTDSFEWGDWQDWLDSSRADIFNLDDKITCRDGHVRQTELLFPKGPSVSHSNSRGCHGKKSAYDKSK
ncbi:malignant fibrous histiocytoma-amplified sequence 1 homolog [Chanos chanos]|uniref:Malignant fibrous histiocytoma-amplified sequence 1 homolog n=1 Tax=Chanos chanos TaxID=29144 RepID=A0A6J2X0I0_CHACN|nr:malignant fibrous histiocytoma-amplified sequence 1 homolog [Chanos chanos]